MGQWQYGPVSRSELRLRPVGVLICETQTCSKECAACHHELPCVATQVSC